MTIMSKTDLAKLGAKVRLEELNKERDGLLDFLGYPKNLKSQIVKDTKKNKKRDYKGKHWTQTPEGKRKLSKISKRMWKEKKAITQ